MTETLVPPGTAVRLIDMPVSVGALVSVDSDGFASIYINARLSCETQRKCLRHELRHLDRNDCFNANSIKDVEDED